jgi:hypothetical protein
MNHELRKQFRKVMQGNNLMTPDIIDYCLSGSKQHICELSNGIGMSGHKIFGVTVVDISSNTHIYKLGRCFTDVHEAREYITKL